jgi:membrane-associated phospholipid phosphatase
MKWRDAGWRQTAGEGYRSTVVSGVTTVGAARGVGEFDLLVDLPVWLGALAGVLTRLGDFWFLVLVLGVAYWQLPENRRHVVAVFGAALGGVGLYRGFKHYLELPRPVGETVATTAGDGLGYGLYESAAAAGGYGFPSGHATSAAVVYLGLAVMVTVGTRRTRYALAATVISIVAATRVLLGVHFLVDVLTGAALGAAWVRLALVLPRRRTPGYSVTVTQLLAIPPVVAYFVTSGGSGDAILLLVGILALLAGWQARMRQEREDTSREHLPRTGLLVTAIGVAGLLVVTFDLPALKLTSVAGAASVGAMLFALAVVLRPGERLTVACDRLRGE